MSIDLDFFFFLVKVFTWMLIQLYCTCENSLLGMVGFITSKGFTLYNTPSEYFVTFRAPFRVTNSSLVHSFARIAMRMLAQTSLL